MPLLVEESVISFGFPFEKLCPRIEEYVELLNFHTEYPCEQEMPELMDYHEYRESEYELGGFYEECVH